MNGFLPAEKGSKEGKAKKKKKKKKKNKETKKGFIIPISLMIPSAKEIIITASQQPVTRKREDRQRTLCSLPLE